MNKENSTTPSFKKVLLKDMSDRRTELFISLDNTAKLGSGEAKPEILANLTNCMIANRRHTQSNVEWKAKGNPIEWDLVEMY